MRKRSLVGLPLLCGLLLATSPAAGGETLTLKRVVDVARQRAPTVRVARAGVAEAESRLVGARLRARDNPVIEGLIGPRWAAGRSTDMEVSLAVPLELGGKRSKRIAVAEAEIAAAQMDVEERRRGAVGAAVAAWYGVVYVQRRVALAEERLQLATELQRTAVARQRAGDVAQFEVNLAESEVARADSEVAAEESRLARARADLAAALGLASSGDLAVAGDLSDRTLFDGVASGVAGDQRADIRAARAQRRAADARLSLAGASRWPDVSLRATYAREEDADVLLGGVAITLPFFDRGQAQRAEARAQQQRADVEVEVLTTAATSEIEGARAAYRAARDAVARLEKGLPRATQNLEMATESYRAGKIDLTTLLIIRRDALDTRREYLDRLLEAALAGVDLWVAVGAP